MAPMPKHADVFLLYHKRSRPSGRALAEALGVPCGYGLRGYTPGKVIRWGSARRLDLPIPTVNAAWPILRASDKYVTLRTLQAAGVACPEATTDPAYAAFWSFEEGEQVVGRTRNGRGGRGITLYQPGDPLGRHQLYTRVLPCQNEYRLHVIGGKVVRTQIKSGGCTETFGRNHDNGWTFVGVTSYRLHPDRYRLAKDAVAALGLDFGAVDLLVTPDDEAFVLEVNTAPAMSPKTLGVYARKIAGLVGRDLPGLDDDEGLTYV